MCEGRDRTDAEARRLAILASYPLDRPDLAAALVRQQFAFGYGMVNVYAHLFLYRWGIANVDVSSLVGIFDSVRVELRTMVPAQMSSAA